MEYSFKKVPFFFRVFGYHSADKSGLLPAPLLCRAPLGKVVGFAGRLAPEKGPGLFLAVAEGIAQLIPSARFVVVGDGPLRPDLEAMASRLGLER